MSLLPTGKLAVVVGILVLLGSSNAAPQSRPVAITKVLIQTVGNEGSITIDAERRMLSLNVPDQEITQRRKAWTPPAPRYRRGVLAKYARLVSSASVGAVTDRLEG